MSILDFFKDLFSRFRGKKKALNLAIKKVWLKVKAWKTESNELEDKRRQLKWAEARLAVKNGELYKDFKEWLLSWSFDLIEIGKHSAKDYAQRCKYDGLSDCCLQIVEFIEDSPKFVDVLTKKIKKLEEKEERTEV